MAITPIERSEAVALVAMLIVRGRFSPCHQVLVKRLNIGNPFITSPSIVLLIIRPNLILIS